MNTRTQQKPLYFFIVGILMGVADPIPGVSAGSIAFIFGIYYRLLAALSAINIQFLKNLLLFRLRICLQLIDWQFLLSLVLGIGLALVLTTNLIHFLLLHHALFLWSFFFGLVALSAFFLLIGCKWDLLGLLFLLVGFFLGYFVSGFTPLVVESKDFFFFFFGFIAIISLLLPGISGALVLVILGQYEVIVGAIKDPFTTHNIIILFYFYCGAIASLLLTPKLLHWLIKKYEVILLFFLSGLMLGSLRKMWPWKEKLFQENSFIEINKFPGLDKNTIFAIIFIGFGILFSIFIKKLPNILKKKY